MPTDRLATYRQKRDPERTPEPFGDTRSGPLVTQRSGGLFVVQQHAARRMHWDVRLDIDGVLMSWAVPRGPSADHLERRLAVLTEPHPIEYADFEGIIPSGNYGAGAMIVWDRGVYHTIDGTAAAQGLESGKLDLQFNGHKLRGRWTLVRTKGEGGRSWLLLHKGGAGAESKDLVQAQPYSVFSGLTVEEVEARVDRSAALRSAARDAGGRLGAVSDAILRPMLAQATPEIVSGKGWVFELKYDGMRILAARSEASKLRLVGRSGREVSVLFPEVVAALRHLPCDDFVIDGEVVALDERGASSFELLQPRMQARERSVIEQAVGTTPVLFYAFDVLHVGGYDVRHLALRARKQLLQSLVPSAGFVRRAEVFDEHDGQTLFETVGELGLEGIVAKQADSAYRSGDRSPAWRKIKARRSVDLAVVGFLRGKGSRRNLGALMLAWRAGDAWRYAGNVGSGFDAETLQALSAELTALVRPTAAFEAVPEVRRSDTCFVEPLLIAEVRYAEVTSAGILRHPVFVGLRRDKRLDEVDSLPTRSHDVPVSAPALEEPVRSAPFRPSNLDKVFWPQDGYTKGDLLAFYETIWPWLSPYLRDRPVVMTRYPDGIDGKNFFQKNAPDFTPSWATTCHIDDTDFFVCNDLDTLRYVINSGCIPLHVWSARLPQLTHPDWAILDLDPKGAPFADVVAVARQLHRLLEELSVPNFMKTSGQDGLHVLIPTGGHLTHEESRALSELLARVVVGRCPEIATIARPLGARGGKVYVDFLQNGYGKTIAGPFSVRPRPGAPVSTPLRWQQVTARLDPSTFTIRTVVQRMQRTGDPMIALLSAQLDWQGTLVRLEGLLR